MDDERTRGFRIDFSDDEPEAPVAEPEPEKTPEQPSSLKPALISVFAFCVLGGLLFFGYYQLNNRINRIDTSGAHEIRDLQSQINARLDEFSKKIEAQSGTIDKRFAQLEKKIQQNAAAMGTLDKQLSNTQETAQSVPSILNRLSAYIAEVDQLKADMESRINGLNEQFQTLEKSIAETDTVESEIQGLQENIDRARAQIEKLMENRIDQQTVTKVVNGVVSDLRSEMNRQLGATENQLKKQMASLQDQINAMDQLIKTLRDIRRSASPMPGQSSGPAQPPPSDDGSGKILEQEIE